MNSRAPPPTGLGAGKAGTMTRLPWPLPRVPRPQLQGATTPRAPLPPSVTTDDRARPQPEAWGVSKTARARPLPLAIVAMGERMKKQKRKRSGGWRGGKHGLLHLPLFIAGKGSIYRRSASSSPTNIGTMGHEEM